MCGRGETDEASHPKGGAPGNTQTGGSMKLYWRTLVSVLGVVATAMMMSCHISRQSLVAYDYSKFRVVKVEDKRDQFPCFDSAMVEVKEIGYDTSNFRVKIMEDDTLYLFSFIPKIDGPRYTEEGDIIVRAREGVDLYFLKEGCRKLLIRVTR